MPDKDHAKNYLTKSPGYAATLKCSITLFSILLLSKLLLAQSAIDSTNHIVPVIDRYEHFFLTAMEEWNLPGAAVAIIKDDRIIYIKGFGIRRAGTQEKVDIHTVFRLASVSKGFASVLTGLLVADGVLNWDDQVLKYLPDFALKTPRATGSLTIRHVLSHTSGLPSHTFTNLLEDNVPRQEIYQKLKDVSLIAPAGKIYSYQNIIYNLISDIIKSATGKSYEQLVSERIFLPLGMWDASLGKASFLASLDHTMPHIRKKFVWTATDVKDAYYMVPAAAGVNASILDMARWLRAMMGGEPLIISPELLQQVTTPLVKTPQEKRKYRWRDQLKDAHYGLGWRIYDYAGTTIVYHGGWVEGFRAEIGFIPAECVGIVVLLNCESVAANMFLPTFFDLYLNRAEPDSITSDH